MPDYGQKREQWKDHKNVGEIRRTIDQCLAELRALASNPQRHLALGVIAASLTETGHIDGMGNIIVHCSQETNRYNHVDLHYLES